MPHIGGSSFERSDYRRIPAQASHILLTDLLTGPFMKPCYARLDDEHSASGRGAVGSHALPAAVAGDGAGWLMEAVLLMLEAVGIILVMSWAARARGDGGILGWRSPTDPKPRPATQADR